MNLSKALLEECVSNLDAGFMVPASLACSWFIEMLTQQAIVDTIALDVLGNRYPVT